MPVFAPFGCIPWRFEYLRRWYSWWVTNSLPQKKKKTIQQNFNDFKKEIRKPKKKTEPNSSQSLPSCIDIMSAYPFWLKHQNITKAECIKWKWNHCIFVLLLFNMPVKEKHHECRQTVWKCLYKFGMVLAVRWLSKSHNFITRNLNFEYTLKSNNWSDWKFIFHFILFFIFSYSSLKME